VYWSVWCTGRCGVRVGVLYCWCGVPVGVVYWSACCTVGVVYWSVWCTGRTASVAIPQIPHNFLSRNFSNYTFLAFIFINLIIFIEYHNFVQCSAVTVTTAVLLQQEHHPEDGRNMLVRTLDKIQHGILKYMSYGFPVVGRD